MFELSNGFCMAGVSKGKINLVELSNVRVNGQSSYRMLTVIIIFTWHEVTDYYRLLILKSILFIFPLVLSPIWRTME